VYAYQLMEEIVMAGMITIINSPNNATPEDDDTEFWREELENDDGEPLFTVVLPEIDDKKEKK
jgi:hypothetical protein